MITFLNLGSFGRFGNQLFQYAILRVLGYEKKYEIKIPNLNDKHWHGQRCLLDNLNIKANKLTDNDTILHHYIENELDYFKYNPNIFNINDHTNIHGYFQNYQYYKKYEDLLIEELTPKQEIIDYNNNVLNKIKEQYKDYQIISLHIRRGDTDLTMYGNDLNKLDINSRWYQYFIKAKEYFKNKQTKFLIFTGGNRVNDNPSLDYIWCKNNFIGEEFIFPNHNNSTINDFTLMCLCDGHILSPISSLSWWVGFLNKKNNDKIIVAPEKYYFLDKKMDDGFYPDNFILL